MVADTLQNRAEETSHCFGDFELAVPLYSEWRCYTQEEEYGGSRTGLGQKRDVFPCKLFGLETAVPDAFSFNQCVRVRSLENGVWLNN